MLKTKERKLIALAVLVVIVLLGSFLLMSSQNKKRERLLVQQVNSFLKNLEGFSSNIIAQTSNGFVWEDDEGTEEESKIVTYEEAMTVFVDGEYLVDNKGAAAARILGSIFIGEQSMTLQPFEMIYAISESGKIYIQNQVPTIEETEEEYEYELTSFDTIPFIVEGHRFLSGLTIDPQIAEVELKVVNELFFDGARGMVSVPVLASKVWPDITGSLTVSFFVNQKGEVDTIVLDRLYTSFEEQEDKLVNYTALTDIVLGEKIEINFEEPT